MDSIFIIGIIGSLILVAGAAYQESNKNKKPTKSIKNRLFTLGSILMLIFSILGYTQGGTILFILLQVLILISCILMMIDIDDKIDSIIIGISGLLLIGLSIYFSNDYNTIIFILGLVGLGLGYAFKMGSLRRNIMLTLGSLFVAVFSYIEGNQIFLRLNVFFFLFSLYYTVKQLKTNK